MGVLSACMAVYTCVLVPKKAKRGCQIYCNWSYTWLWAALCVFDLVFWKNSQHSFLTAKLSLWVTSLF